MTRSHRIPPLPHWNAPKGHCRWCGDAVPKGRRSWCSQACVDAYLLATSSDAQRRVCERRDKGICARCGRDAESVVRAERETERMWAWLARRHFEDAFRKGELQIAAWSEIYTLTSRAVADQARELGHTNHSVSAWQADHIRALCHNETGDLSYWSADNLQTLCHKCHAAKSGQDRKTANLLRKRLTQPTLL